jgi:hypothetical protein
MYIIRYAFLVYCTWFIAGVAQISPSPQPQALDKNEVLTTKNSAAILAAYG